MTDKNRSERVESGRKAVVDAFAASPVFQLDDKSWKAFMTALARPPKDNPGLRRLLAHKPAWEA